MTFKLCPSTRDVLQTARLEASSRGQEFVDTEHLLLALVKSRSTSLALLFGALGTNLSFVEHAIGDLLPRAGKFTRKKRITALATTAAQAMQFAKAEADSLGDGEISPEHLLLGIVRAATGSGAKLLAELRIEYQAVHECIVAQREEDR